MKHMIIAAFLLSATQNVFAQNNYFEKALELYNSADPVDLSVLPEIKKFAGHCIRYSTPTTMHKQSFCLTPLADDPILGEGISFEPLSSPGYACNAAGNDYSPIYLSRQANEHMGVVTTNRYDRHETWLRYATKESTWVYLYSIIAPQTKYTWICYAKDSEI